MLFHQNLKIQNCIIQCVRGEIEPHSINCKLDLWVCEIIQIVRNNRQRILNKRSKNLWKEMRIVFFHESLMVLRSQTRSHWSFQLVQMSLRFWCNQQNVLCLLQSDCIERLFCCYETKTYWALQQHQISLLDCKQKNGFRWNVSKFT